MALAPAGSGFGPALAAPNASARGQQVVRRPVSWADLEAPFLGVVGLVLGRRDDGQVCRFDAAHVPTLLVVHVFLSLDRSADVGGHHDVGAADCHARALLARVQRTYQAAVLIAAGGAQDPGVDVGQDGYSGAVSAHALSVPAPGGARGAGCRPTGTQAEISQLETRSLGIFGVEQGPNSDTPC